MERAEANIADEEYWRTMVAIFGAVDAHAKNIYPRTLPDSNTKFKFIMKQTFKATVKETGKSIEGFLGPDGLEVFVDHAEYEVYPYPEIELEAEVRTARVGKRFIKVISDDGRWLDPTNDRYYDEDELIFDGECWTDFRNAAAMNIMSAFAGKVAYEDIEDLEPNYYARIAVEWADALINALRNG